LQCMRNTRKKAMALSHEQANELTRALDASAAQSNAELRRELPELSDQSFLELAGAAHDPGDESVADLVGDVNVALLERHFAQLRDIEAARKRLADGVIDVCVDCDNEIAYQRLLASPTAVRDIDCQRRYETLHSGEPPPRL